MTNKLTPPAFALALAVMLTGCGGGGTSVADGGAAPVAAAPAPAAPAPAPEPVADAAAPTPAASAPVAPTTGTCATRTNTDVLGGLAFQTSHRINAREYGCQIVRKDDGHPVVDGAESARFEVRDGDCSATATYDDCTQDRSRHEINETTVAPTTGSTLVYTTHLFIPVQQRLKPRGRNTMFLTQINVVDGDDYGTLAYLEIADNGELWVRTDKGFTFAIEKQYPVVANPVGRWIKVTWEIRSSTATDGYLKVYVDDVLKVHEGRPTLPSATAAIRLKIGIYNVFRSRATEPYAAQVVYFDGIAKSVR